MKPLYSYKKLLSFLPAIFMAILIFWFSAQKATDSSQLSGQFTYRLIKGISQFLHISLTESESLHFFEQFHGIIRKIAHFSEYYIFALTVFLPYYVYGKREKKHLFYTICICFLYACSDELHQLFSDGRSGQFRDVLIDTSGSSLAMLTTYFFHFIRNIKSGT